MNVFIIISFITLGVAAFVIQKKRRFNQIDILHLLFFGAISELLKSGFEDAHRADMWSYSVITLLAFNFLISRFEGMRKPILRLVAPVVSFGVLLALFWNDSFVYLGKNFNISDKATWILPILGVFMYEFAFMKINFLQKYFEMKDSAVNVQMSFLVGVAILIGAFNAQGYGVLLVGAGFLAGSFYNTVGSKHIIHSLMAVSLVWMFADQNAIELIDLRFPKVIGGLFVGAFVGLFIQHIWTIRKNVNPALFICYFICTTIILGMLVFKSMINASFGGVEAFLGGLIGYALSNVISYYHDPSEEHEQAPIAMTGLVIMIVIGILVPPLLVSEEEMAVQKTLNSMTPKNEIGEVVEVPFVAFTDLIGSHTIKPATSLISFKLGPNGSVTKGAIKDIQGSFNFTEDLTQSSFDIKMEVLKLTTFIGMRDQSIMGAEYFNQVKFPTMRFKGSRMTPTDKENEFEMNGTFEMLGVQNEQKVKIHRIEDGTKKVLIGSGEIDRRKFGMADDPREGNLVSFEFKVELK